MSHGLAIRFALAVGLLALYLVTLGFCARTEFFQRNLGTASSPLFPWIQYLWWVPFGIAILLAVRPHLSQSAAVRSLVFALLFAPGLLGIYGVGWLVPAFVAIGTPFLYGSFGMLPWVAVFTGVPFLFLWLLSYSVIRLTRLWQGRRGRAQGSRT